MCVCVCLFIGIILITFSPSENATVATKEKTLRKTVTSEGERIQAAPSKLTCKDILWLSWTLLSFFICLSCLLALRKLQQDMNCSVSVTLAC